MHDDTIKQINIYVLKEFYMRGFGEESQFYAQFEQRLKVKGHFTEIRRTLCIFIKMK